MRVGLSHFVCHSPVQHKIKHYKKYYRQTHIHKIATLQLETKVNSSTRTHRLSPQKVEMRWIWSLLEHFQPMGRYLIHPVPGVRNDFLFPAAMTLQCIRFSQFLWFSLHHYLEASPAPYAKIRPERTDGNNTETLTLTMLARWP